ncbi:hypothetical protein [Pseudoduganella sp. RAF53_2]|uniref:hypothetical protein n=1 Tax=unclassified Pseudoduganella TaxID=2637179 RepID=UPI003F9E9D1E
MKANYVGTAAALAAALALSACGGKASFDVSGTVTTSSGSPIANSGLVLQNGDDTVSVPLGQTSFTFPNRISYGTEYNVTVKTQPAHMTCSIANPTGSAGHTATISVAVICSQNSYTVGGTISNLTLDGLSIINGSNSSAAFSVAKGSTAFVYPESIPVGTPYGLSIFTQPKDTTTGATQTCTLINGTDVMGDANRANVVITCQ